MLLLNSACIQKQPLHMYNSLSSYLSNQRVRTFPHLLPNNYVPMIKCTLDKSKHVFDNQHELVSNTSPVFTMHPARL